ncbi:MAG: helix-turn-helix domain-containing protein [Verrucomicrobiaceae bacterium]|nr:MAG: helix-turn-helix domain-containing protein [Verrucomicrobiaceae bacterium]
MPISSPPPERDCRTSAFTGWRSEGFPEQRAGTDGWSFSPGYLQMRVAMKRGAIPLIGITDRGREHLLRDGVLVLPFEVSSTRTPGVLRPHYHDYFQVSLLSAPAHVMHDFREFDVEGDTLLFLSPGQVHTVTPGPGMKGVVISFTREFIGGAPGFLLDLPFFYSADSCPWLVLDGKNAGIVQRVFGEMLEEYDSGGPGSGEILSSLLRILFVRAARWHDSETDSSRSRGEVLVRKFHQEVERHFLEWQALGPYAKLLGVTVNHLNDVVREVTGKAAGEHIRTRRLLDAKRLLLYSELSVSEVGYHLGFKDPSYFSRFFRRYETGTPGEFRSRIREKYQKNGA